MNSERKHLRRLVAWLPLILLLAACDPQRDPASLFAPLDVDVPVVDGVLVVGKPLPTILLSRTQPADRPYSFRDAAIREADVRLITAAADTILYHESDRRGFYHPPHFSNLVVAPQTTYRLIVITEAGERIAAETTTPARLSVAEWVLLAGAGNPADRTLGTFAEFGDQVYEVLQNQLVYPQGILEASLDIDPAAPAAPGFQLALFSLDFGSDLVIDPPFLDDDDLAAIQRQSSSPVFEAADGRVRLPWFAVFFQGRHLYKIQSLDRNAFDLVRSTPQGGLAYGGNAGDNFERPIYHIDGGIGLFGSVSVDSVGFTIWSAP